MDDLEKNNEFDEPRVSGSDDRDFNDGVGVQPSQGEESEQSEIEGEGLGDYSFCPKCGAPVKLGQQFCGKCGQRISSEIDDNPRKAFGKKAPVKFIIAAVLIIVVLFGGYAVIGQMMVPPEELIARGDFEGAYGRAFGDEEKTDVLVANKVATLCPDLIDGLKDPSSFELKAAWYDPEESRIVLQVSANNLYGATVTNYYYYTVDSDTGDYSLYVPLSDLEDEELSSFDDTDELARKLAYNRARRAVRRIIENRQLKLSREYVNSINDLFESDLIFDTEPLDDTVLLISADSSVESDA